MKTANCNPILQNEPLRLTEEQLKKPLLAISDFFQSYHLQDVREMLWAWTTAVISSPSSISSEPLDRANHIYFYEKIEQLIEAAFIFYKKHNHGIPQNTSE